MRHAGFLVLLAMITVACASRQPQPSSSAQGAAGLVWTARMLPMVATGTRIVGNVRISPATRPNSSRILVDISGGAIANRHPWAIRSGGCDELIPIDLGGRAMYPSLELRTDGAIRWEGDLPVTVPTDQRYHVAIFASAVERDFVVSCGELRVDR